MNDFGISGVRTGVFGIGLCLLLVGCASEKDQNFRQLCQQQTATIESLQTEITRLNQELEGNISARDGFGSAKAELEKIFADKIASGDVRISSDSRGLVASMLDRMIFDPEETRLLPSGEEYLDKLAKFFAGDFSKNRIFIEGHTDNQPVEGDQRITNWEYSVGRATAVLHYFVDSKKLAPERFRVSGYGEFHPIDSNDTEAGRERNRRVEVVISTQKVTDV